MNYKPITLFTLLFCFSLAPLFSQTEWEKVKEEDGIIVYSRDLPNSNFKEFKTIAESALVSHNAVVGQLNDVESHPEVFKTVEKATLTENTPRRYKIFSLLDLPWPMSDRSMWIDNIITHNDEASEIKIDIDCIPELTYEEEGYFHIENCNGHWFVKSIAENESYIEYQFFLDLGGNAPARLVNMKSIEENYKTVKSVIDRGDIEKYKKYVLK